MLFLKVTRSVKGFSKRFGWLLAELVFVFLGMYGAFLLERMQDEEIDLLRKRQILQALVDEFENYETELGNASYSLHENYCVPFFTKYSSGEKPFPDPIPFGAMGSVNTGIWEAMLQSGGIEVLEVELIQRVQGFFKKLQDLLDIYTRLERLSERMIMPEMDRDAEYFYEADGIELRDKYKWHVNMLYTIDLFLSDLSKEAVTTKNLLLAEFAKIKDEDSLEEIIEKKSEEVDDVIPDPEENSPPPDSIDSNIDDTAYEESEQVAEEEAEAELPNLSDIIGFSRILIENVDQFAASFENEFAMPFLLEYSEGQQPVPLVFAKDEFIFGGNMEELQGILLWVKESDVTMGSNPSFDALINLVGQCVQAENRLSQFTEKSQALIEQFSGDGNSFYEGNSTTLGSDSAWYIDELFSVNFEIQGLKKISQEIIGSVEELEKQVNLSFKE